VVGNIGPHHILLGSLLKIAFFLLAAQPPGLGPRTRRSTATTSDMADAAAAGGGEEEAPLVPYVLGLPIALPLPVAVSRLDAAVPRKARSRPLPRAKPAGLWAFRLPVPLPKEAKTSPEEARSPRPQRLLSACLGLGAPDTKSAATEERPAKRARRCVQCGSVDTPQWRSGPMGPSTLCNACGVRLRAVGALRETVQMRPPPAATPRKAADPPPAESPASVSSLDSLICPRPAPLGDVYLVRKQPKLEKQRAPRSCRLSMPAGTARCSSCTAGSMAVISSLHGSSSLNPLLDSLLFHGLLAPLIVDRDELFGQLSR
jgi:GATA-binding protein, other eukaryote